MSRISFTLRPHHAEIGADILLQIGRVVSYRGRIEFTLDSDIRHLWMFPVGQSLREEMPIGFKRRIKLWSRLHRAVCADRPAWLVEVNALQQRMGEAAKMRHILTHSSWNDSPELTRREPPRILLCNRRAENNGIVYREYQISVDDVKQTADELTSIYDCLVTYTLRRITVLGIPGASRS